nr:immunoglobulin heavy chain junction region [Macaca mulatta]MOX58891.1 immunoglobulin heavy chain junction region [Macaca mulatta]MOX59204.1 immunoglobulin heavy chain junction region [Macaca mulatta]MOX59207.1 immunoglobulin heavy chain junction region [Macaca mulatta]MOX59382.1 immunoglobulin heavy chain junction region [Macaca mulatta]
CARDDMGTGFDYW